MLLDFLTKRFFHKVSSYFFYIFTIFFGDKFILEHFFSNFSLFTSTLSTKLKNLSKTSFINFFKVTLYILFYVVLVSLIIYIF